MGFHGTKNCDGIESIGFYLKNIPFSLIKKYLPGHDEKENEKKINYIVVLITHLVLIWLLIYMYGFSKMSLYFVTVLYMNGSYSYVPKVCFSYSLDISQI